MSRQRVCATLVASVLAVGCNPSKPTPAPVVVASAPSSLPVPDAAAAPTSEAPPFTIYARFTNEQDITLTALKDGIAVAQHPRIFKDGEIAWKLYTLAFGKLPVVVVPRQHGQLPIEEPPEPEPGPTAPPRRSPKDEAHPGASSVESSSGGSSSGSPPRPARAPRGPSHRTGDDSFMALWGTTELVFLKLDSGGLLRATPKGTTIVKRDYDHVVELGPGQWVGRRLSPTSNSALGTGEAPPVHYELLAGSGKVLPIPPKIVPTGAVHLADGRICARTYPRVAADAVESAVWTADLGGRQNETQVPEVIDIFRGADGECWALTEHAGVGIAATRAVVPIRGDGTGEPVSIPRGDEPTHLDRQGGIWAVDDDKVLFRTVVEGGRAKSTRYPLPSTVDDCERPRVHAVAALAPDDVWIVVECANPGWQDAGGYKYSDDRRVLMHTGPSPQPVFVWPSY